MVTRPAAGVAASAGSAARALWESLRKPHVDARSFGAGDEEPDEGDV
ncbi:hypothetical protein ABT063_01825 [Streptomyces sp. NPDC002838]